MGSFGKKKKEELCKDNFPKQHETCQIVKLKVKCTGALQIKERNADNVGPPSDQIELQKMAIEICILK